MVKHVNYVVCYVCEFHQNCHQVLNSLNSAAGVSFHLWCFPGQVYDGRGTLEEGETAEERFIKIQAAYELLIDVDKRKQYDREHRVNPMKVGSIPQST